MALKLVFLFACFIVVATQVASAPADEEKFALRMGNFPLYMSSRVTASEPAPGPGAASPSSRPTSPRSHLGYCVPKCQEKCKAYRRMRPCVRVCTQCCEQNNRCVPVGYETCPNWTTVVYHGETRKCP